MPVPGIEWLERVNAFVNRLTVNNGDLNWIGGRPVLDCWGSGGGGVKSFKATLNQGSDPDHATVKIDDGWFEWHQGIIGGASGTLYYGWDWTDSGDDITLATGYNVVYAELNLESGVTAIGKNADTTEEDALTGVVSTNTLLRVPLICYDYDASTFTAEFVRIYHEGNISVIPIYTRQNP